MGKNELSITSCERSAHIHNTQHTKYLLDFGWFHEKSVVNNWEKSGIFQKFKSQRKKLNWKNRYFMILKLMIGTIRFGHVYSFICFA